MKDVTIVIATHKEAAMPSDSTLYLPVQVGAAGKADLGYQRDDQGQEISALNPYYCELTGLYWAWKNLDADYLGLVHYRRYFVAKAQPYRPGLDMDSLVLTQDQVEALLDQSPVLVPKKRRYVIETLYSHYAHTLDGSHLDLTRDIIARQAPDSLAAFDAVMRQRSGYMFNMFIMARPLVDRYLTWLFPILDALYQELDMTGYTPFEARLYGRVSELLFNVWLKQEGIQPKEVPFMYMEKVDLWQKGKAFLQAKFFGKKYGKSF